LAQLDPEIRSAILGNIGTLISFRVGTEDTRMIAPHFAPHLTPSDLLNLPNRDFYLKLMINGQPSAPFSATASDPLITQDW
jgi:hypothetical protein